MLEIKNIKSLEELKKQQIVFEDAYNTLEHIVSTQEKGDISLEDSVHYYKAGKILAKYCTELLTNAKTDVQTIVDKY